MCDLIDRAVAATASYDNARPLILHRDRACEDIEIVTDLDRLCQVFINLVSNTRKYCAADAPELTIEVVRREADIEIFFADNGAGIPVKQREIVFEKFSRLSDAEAAGSAGLGLAISREIMRNLGGTITYAGDRPGTVFRVVLPASGGQK